MTTAPAVTYADIHDAWTARRYYVDGEEVATVRAGEAKVWHCDPGHRLDFIGGTFGPVGEHVPGCGWVMSSASWAVYPRSWHAPPRFYGELTAAYVEAERLADQARLCSRPARARLCRLLKRHNGPCVPWD